MDVDQASWPLDHGTVCFKWSHGESNPDLLHGELASSCWTMTRCVLSGSRETRTHKRLYAATCFQDRLLIRPDGFHRQAAEAGIEPASGRLTAAYPYQHGSHRNPSQDGRI